jgi:hypothetical protein
MPVIFLALFAGFVDTGRTCLPVTPCHPRDVSMVRSLLFGLLFCVCSGQVFAGIEVLRDSIGPDGALTDGLPGGSTHHAGLDFSSPGLVFDTSNAGLLSEASFVIFARDASLNPENDLADIYTYHMEFHVWTEGILGGTDSYDQNPRGDALGGHILVDANTPDTSIINVEAWGQTGPPADPKQFTTFLVTVDLSSVGVELQGGQQYLMSLLHRGNNFGTTTGGARSVGGFFHISGSMAASTTEDLHREEDSIFFPGYIDSQHGLGFEQYGGSLDLENGDHDSSNSVDGFDFLKWQRGESPQPLSSLDLAAWEVNFGETLTPPLAAVVSTPEPSTLLLASLAGVLFCSRRR